MQRSRSSLWGYGWAWLVMVSAACSLNNFALGFADEKSELPSKAKAILTAKCYSCHGEAGSADGGINFILNRDRLVKRRKLVIGKSDDSVIFRQIKTGRMPKDDDPLSAEEIDVMKRWIDSGAVDFNPKTNARTFISSDDVLTFIRDDLRSLEKDDPEKLPYFRYFTITHLYNSGLSDDELRSYRVALSKLVNSLSWKKRIVLPHPVDPAKTVFRICLSDYRWSPKTWDRIAGEYPYGVKSLAPAMQFCYSATQTNLPCVRADWFVAKAAMPPLYHEILELPESVGELEQLLRIDVEHNIASGAVARAAFNGSGVSSHNRLIERHDCDLTGGVYWKSYDFGEDKERRNLFSHPLGPGGANGFEHDGGELFFSLPNGLQAYLLVDKDGQRIDKGPISVVSDPRRLDRQVVNGLSCMSCHAEGVKRKADEVRAAVLANPQAFTAVEVTQVKKLYKTNEDLEKLFDADAKQFAKAVAQTGGKTSGDEPIVMLALRFEEEVDLDLAAAEVGMNTETLKSRLEKSTNLSRLLPTLKVPGGTVKREAFVSTFPTLVRELRLGQFLGSTDSVKEQLVTPGTVPDIPVPRTTTPKVSGKSSSSSKAFTPATRAPADFTEAQKWHTDNLARLQRELAEMRRKALDKAVPKLRELQTRATKAGRLNEAVAIRDFADRLSQNSGVSAKQWDSLKSTSGLPNEVAAIMADILKEGSADSSRLSEEVKKLNLELAQRMEPAAAAALSDGDLEKSRLLLSQLYSLRVQSFPYYRAGSYSKPSVFPDEALKFIEPFKNKAEQRLANADKEEEKLRNALMIKLKDESKRKDLSEGETTALAATVDFLESESTKGLRFVQILKADRKLPEAAVTAMTEFMTAANPLLVKLSEEHQAAWEALNDELKPVRMALAKKGAFESAFVVVEQTPNLKRVLEPVSVKAAYGSSPRLSYTWDAELLEVKGGQFLIRFKQREGQEPEWVTRDRFRIQGESVDATAALNAGDLEQSRELLSQLYSSRGKTFPYHWVGNYSKPPVFPDEALKLVEPFKIKAEQRRMKADKDELKLRKALISKLKVEAKRKDLSEDETTALETTVVFLDADYSQGLRFLPLFKEDRKLPETAGTTVAEFVTATNALTLAMTKEHQAAWEALNEELKTLRKALAKKGEFESAFVVLEQTPNLKRVFEPISVKAARGSSPDPHYVWDAELLEVNGGKYLIRFKQGSGETEWVARDRFQVGAVASGPFAAAARRPQPPAGFPTNQNQPPPGDPVTNTTKLKKGEKLLINHVGRWVPVTVLDLTPAGVKIHWDGWPDTWDQVVDRSRLRLIKGDEKAKE